jgi:glycosyltransferase involved in cell wall biosynthesis
MTGETHLKNVSNPRSIHAEPTKLGVGAGGISSRTKSVKVGSEPANRLSVALLTGGWDKPYALGLTAALVAQGVAVDFLGTPEVDAPELHNNAHIRFVDLQKNARPGGGLGGKALRALIYYWRTIAYAATAKPKVFHILWDTKVLLFDRTILTLIYKLLGKRLAFTAHNVNAGKRDGTDSWLNRFTLKIQYWLVDHIFVHTEKMKTELIANFQVRSEKVSVIPFGINSTVPNTQLTGARARERLGLQRSDKVLLFFGNILPYKGLEFLIKAFERVAGECPDYRLIIAGKPKPEQPYFHSIKQMISTSRAKGISARFEYVPDEETEIYFKAADVLVLPYVEIFQSGVLFLAYNFGLPVIASDVGSLKEEIADGITGFVCKPRDPIELADTIRSYFSSNLFAELEIRRPQIGDFAKERYSWAKIGCVTNAVFSRIIRN